MARNVGARASAEDECNSKFPEGMRVLAVDDNAVCLMTLVALLEKCRYKVRSTMKATEALKLLTENKDGFDIVITDVVMPEMDGFKLLKKMIEHNIHLPVIMLSTYGDMEKVMKGVKRGADGYLLKPPRMEEIKNIWQHVVRKKLCGPNNNRPFVNKPAELEDENNNNKNDAQFIDKVVDRMNPDEQALTSNNGNVIQQQQQLQEPMPDDHKCSSKKKPRFQWTSLMHQQFLLAIQRLGVEEAVPKRILEVMNVPGLTRENVASHLQKYRNNLKNAKKRDISNGAGSQMQAAAVPSFDKSGTGAAVLQNRPEFQAAIPVRNQVTQSGGSGALKASIMKLKSHLLHQRQQEMLLQQPLQGPSIQLGDHLMQPKMQAPRLGDAVLGPILPWTRPPESNLLEHENCVSRWQHQVHAANPQRQAFSHINPSSSSIREPNPSSFWNSIPTNDPRFDLRSLACQMLGNGVESEMPRICSDFMPGPSFIPGGQNEVGRSNYNNFNGGEIDYSEIVNATPLSMQGPAMDNPVPYPQTIAAQHALQDMGTGASFIINSDGSIVNDNIDNDNFSALMETFCS